jgi:hypothetical protein
VAAAPWTTCGLCVDSGTTLLLVYDPANQDPSTKRSTPSLTRSDFRQRIDYRELKTTNTAAALTWLQLYSSLARSVLFWDHKTPSLLQAAYKFELARKLNTSGRPLSPIVLGSHSMFLVPTPQPQHNGLVDNYTPLPRAPEQQLKRSNPGAKLGKLLNAADSSMERSVHDYSHSGLPSPYPSVSGDNQSEASSADHASAAPYPSNQEARPANYSTSATPTSEYGAYPQSARSTSSFPEQSLRHQYHPASNHNGSSGGMAQQTTTSPSLPLQDGRNHQPQQVKSDSDVPIDPSIAAPSPPYPHGQYSPYNAPPQDMPHQYPQGAPAGLYAQPRPDWGNYAHPGQVPHTHPVPYSHTQASAPPGRPQQVGEDVYVQ